MRIASSRSLKILVTYTQEQCLLGTPSINRIFVCIFSLFKEKKQWLVITLTVVWFSGPVEEVFLWIWWGGFLINKILHRSTRVMMHTNATWQNKNTWSLFNQRKTNKTNMKKTNRIFFYPPYFISWPLMYLVD